MKNLLFVLPVLAALAAGAQSTAPDTQSTAPDTQSTAPDTLLVNWSQTQRVSNTTLTLQVVVNPPLRRGASIHDPSFAALKALGCDYVRYVPWLPYPRLGVAELTPPTGGHTSWDFSVIDPLTLDFLNATKGHSVIVNFSTIPTWMYKTDTPVTYPGDPDQVDWDYTQGTKPVDPTYGQIGAYYARLYSWYTKGGFTDELGKRHGSGYHYAIPYWEVLNEVDYEHANSVQSYTKEYDAIVTAIRKESPGTKFVGMALAGPNRPEWFEYFLDRKHHLPGVPLDMISYHFYAIGGIRQGVDVMQYTFWDQADGFLHAVQFIDNIRHRLSPATKTTIDEIGSILDSDNGDPGAIIPDSYWNLSGALYAYVYLGLARLGIDIAGESQLVGYPTQFPSVSMINWRTGRPNARYWVLKLLKDNLGRGDTLVNSWMAGNEPQAADAITAQAFTTASGRRLLLINRRNRTVRLVLPPALRNATISVVDPSTGDQKPRQYTSPDAPIELQPFAVALISG